MRAWCLAGLLFLAATSTASGAAPILDPLGTTLARYQGAPAAGRPLPATVAPRNPYLARDPRSNIHNDTWMTDAYRLPGPLGRSPRAFSAAMPPALCGSLTFHSRGYLVSVCPSVGTPPQARVVDPATLEVLATYDMPTAPDPPGTRAYQNFAGGGYFFLDGRDRIWSATKTSHIFVLAVAPDGRAITKVGDYDLSGVLAPDERISSALPDFKGRIWFVSKRNGKVGILDPRTRRVRSCASARTSRTRSPSTATPSTSSQPPHVPLQRPQRQAARRLEGPLPELRRRQARPGRRRLGHHADDHERRLRRDHRQRGPDERRRLPEGEATPAGRRRVVCEVPVFDAGASATENSLITARRSLFVENNYGYQDPFGPSSGALTTPGFARVDVKRGGTGCRKVWTNRTERAPTVVSKLSTRPA